MLGETGDGQLIHIELQSSNDPSMALRMAEYALLIMREFGRFPEQVVLYVGLPPLRMNPQLTGPHLAFNCRIVDIRELDGEGLLESASLEDNIVGILSGLRDERAAVRRVLERIAASDAKDRPIALAELMILAGLRKMSAIIEQEAKRMPILDDIMDHEVLGREFKRGLAQGREQGREQGLATARTTLLRLIEKRFGQIPDWARQKVNSLDAAAIGEIIVKAVDAPTLEALFA